MLTTIKCLPTRHGRLRAWEIVQVDTGRRRQIKILAPTGVEAIRLAREIFGRSWRKEDK